MTERVLVSKRLVLMNSASSVATQMLSITVLIWLQQYLIKRITPEEYSILPVLYAAMMFAPLITTILTGGLGRYIVEAYSRKDDERVSQIVSTMFPILCLAGLVFLTAGCSFAWFIDKFLKIVPERLWDARVMMAMLMLSAAIRLPLAPFTVGLFVRQKFVLQNIIRLSVEVFRISLLFVLLFGISTRVLWVVVASSSAELLSLLLTFIVSSRLMPVLAFSRAKMRWSIAGEITSFGGWSFVNALANTVRMAFDPIILNRFASPLDVTNYYIGSIPFTRVQQLSNMVRDPLGPPLIAMHALQERARLANAYIRGGRIALWFALLPAVPLFVFSNELITLYIGPEYLDAANVMRLLLLLFPIAYGNTMFPQIAEATSRIRVFAIRFLMTNAINLGLTLLFVGYYHMGAIGSALGTAIALAVCYPLSMWPAGRKLVDVDFHRWYRESLAPGYLPALIALIAAYAAKWVFSPSSWVSLGFCAAFSMTAYGAAWYFGALQPVDKKNLESALSELRTKMGFSK